MRIEIDEEDVGIIIHNWTPFTIELFKLYSNYFNELIIHQKVADTPVVADKPLVADNPVVGDKPVVAKKKRESYRYWSDKDNRFVVENCDKMSIGKMAVELNRTENAVRHRVKELQKKREIPNCMDLFLSWLESNNKPVFGINDFMSPHPQITKKIADRIITYQLQKGNLQQMSKGKFMRREKTGL